MNDARNPILAQRKQPRQARSSESVTVILQAAAQVLAKEGAQRFTTARVAEKAGVSIGSLYQYFPNKAAILFRLQSEEWQQTSTMLKGILEDTQMEPLERLRVLVLAFVRSECDEAAMRVALEDAAPLYRDAPQAHAARAGSEQTVLRFMEEVLPEVAQAQRELAAGLIKSTLGAVGKQFSEKPRSEVEIQAYSGAMADMFCAYLQQLQAGRV